MDIELPLDFDGFLRRECPNCEQEFKWHHGKTDSAPADFVYPDVHWCPLCGRSATLDQWSTPAQLEYVQAIISGTLLSGIADELFGKLGNSKNFKVTHTTNRADAPDPLVEDDDMTILEPPCHPWEPVKVSDTATPPHFCLICGGLFTV